MMLQILKMSESLTFSRGEIYGICSDDALYAKEGIKKKP
jgi:hypothetical protein